MNKRLFTKRRGFTKRIREEENTRRIVGGLNRSAWRQIVRTIYKEKKRRRIVGGFKEICLAADTDEYLQREGEEWLDL